MCPTLTTQQKHALRLKAISYHLVQGNPFHKHHSEVLLCYLEYDEAQKVLMELDHGLAGGHYARDTTAHKIMGASFCWPNLCIYLHAYVQKCQQ